MQMLWLKQVLQAQLAILYAPRDYQMKSDWRGRTNQVNLAYNKSTGKTHDTPRQDIARSGLLAHCRMG
jgi:hypothetical protein